MLSICRVLRQGWKQGQDCHESPQRRANVVVGGNKNGIFPDVANPIASVFSIRTVSCSRQNACINKRAENGEGRVLFFCHFSFTRFSDILAAFAWNCLCKKRLGGRGAVRSSYTSGVWYERRYPSCERHSRILSPIPTDRGGSVYVQKPRFFDRQVLKAERSFLYMISQLPAMFLKRFSFLSVSFNRLNLKRIPAFFLLRF